MSIHCVLCTILRTCSLQVTLGKQCWGFETTYRTFIHSNQTSLTDIKLLRKKKYIYIFLGPHSRHRRFPGQGSNQSYSCRPTPATVTWDLSHVCNLHQSLNPLSKARDQTHSLMVSSRIHFRCSMMGTPQKILFEFIL